jgi:hypothetical protein
VKQSPHTCAVGAPLDGGPRVNLMSKACGTALPPQRPEAGARTPADLALAVESLRLSVRNSTEKGDYAEMGADAGQRPEQMSRQLSAPPPEGQSLTIALVLAAINREIRRCHAERIEAWKQLLFGGVTEIHEDTVNVVRFPKDGRQFRLEGI